MNKALINYQKTMSQLLKSQNIQSQLTTANQLVSNKAFSRAVKELSSPQFQQSLNSTISSIISSKTITELSSINSKIFEDFSRQMNHNRDLFKYISQSSNLKIPNVENMTTIVTEHGITKMNDMKVTSETTIEDFHTNFDIDTEDSFDETVKDEVQKLTSKHFQALWSYIVKVNEGTIGTTAHVTSSVFVSGSDWFNFFMILCTIQFIIYMWNFEPKEQVEKKIK
ncbi:hypothetical protein [Staphylococcus pasteuri]|uniref:hypothetical protein n=1 Tax=Staphylococcus pasteuri TaxID=45972 RepID=UPI002DBAD718|nr:hypothetical protein [Staphylococcus pasteuri]MEB7435539.1 hypothetical protein [Staphylococcus pasteuri]